MVDAEPSGRSHNHFMSVITMKSVSKSYDGRTVLEGIDLEVEQGEVLALLGPNGAGKTTAVEILEGYRRADGGQVRVLGTDPIEGGPAFRSRIGIVLQQTTAFEQFTVSETVEMFAATFPDPLPTDQAIGLVGLANRADAMAVDLSGGQRRRLDVACGLVGRPELLFLDEPSTGLDPEARRQMWEVIAGLGDSGTTVLLTTHYLEEAEALADRIAVLVGGRIAADDHPARLGDRHLAPARVAVSTEVEMIGDGWRTDPSGGFQSLLTRQPDVVVAELMGRHGRLPGLTVTRPTLEDVYLAMIDETANEIGASR